jgi:dTMP kinase
MIIEIEGIDGAGKTVQCNLLKERLTETGRNVIVVKDLESTPLGKGVRQVLVQNDSRKREVELFAFLACKAQLYTQVITPFVATGGIVVCDRGIGSFISYFESLGLPRQFLSNSVDLALNGLRPRITIFINTSVDEADRRKAEKQSLSKFDLMGDDFFHKQHQVFVDLAHSPSWRTVDGSGSIEEIAGHIFEHVGSVLC